MPRGIPTGCAALGLALALLAATAAPASERSGSDPELAARALAECEHGRAATDRATREQAFTTGRRLAEQAVELNENSAAAHFALFCNMGELLRLDGEQLSSIFKFRRVMSELDRTLALDPNHLKAKASKGILLVRLPRMLGGDSETGEQLLRQVVEADASAVASRIVLAERCQERGDISEALAYAERALEVASERGEDDRVEEALAVLAKIESDD